MLSGDDFTSMPTVLIGGKGVISVTSNVEPKGMADMMEAALAGNLAKANEIHYRLFPLMGAMFCYPSPAPAKKALELMGRIRSAEVRLPMTSMDDASIEVLKKAMREGGTAVAGGSSVQFSEFIATGRERQIAEFFIGAEKDDTSNRCRGRRPDGPAYQLYGAQ